MVIGFNEPRPTKEDYFKFQEKFVSGLNNLDIEGLTYLLYGSFPRGTAVYGRSDIDGLLVFPDEFVINKENFKRVKGAYHKAKEGLTVPLQIQVTDLGNLRDGRFFSYEPQFKEVFEFEAKSYVGISAKELISLMNFQRNLDSNLMMAVFNLSQLRKGFLRFNFTEVDDPFNYMKFLEGFNKMLERVGRMATKFPHICFGENCNTERFEGIGGLESELDLDFEPLRKGRILLKNPELLNEMYYKPYEMLELWEESLTLYEQFVEKYCKMVKVPKVHFS